MPYPICPHCGTPQVLDARTYGHYKGPVTCGHCQGKYHVALGDDFNAGMLFGRGPGGVLLSAPRPLGDPELLKALTAPTIPGPLYRDFAEAARCLEMDVPRATTMLCRHAIQRALLLKGVADDQPEKMVNVAWQQEILSPMAHRQCSAAVFMGGKGSHPQSDWADQIGADEAKQALLVTKRVLLELFNPDPGAVQDAL